MIKHISFLILILGLCISCNQIDKPKKPDNLIVKDKMVDILFDVFVFNAAKGSTKKVLQDNNVTPNIYIYEKHQIDSLQFVKSNEYYAYDIKEYEEIIDRVETKIKTLKDGYQEELDIEEERRQKRLDSIKRLGDTLKIKRHKKKVKTLNQN